MSAEKLFGPERKPWEENADHRLAPSSYAATAVFGIAELAYEYVEKHDLETTGANVSHYARIFARILVKAQLELGSGGGWASSLNTRLRGALRTALELTPGHLGDQEDVAGSLAAWETELYETVVRIAKTAAWLYSRTPQQIMESR